MSRNIIITARTFALKELKGGLNIESLSDAVKRCGYDLIYYDTDKQNEIIKRLKYINLSKRVNGFTAIYDVERYVFIKNNLTEEDKLITLVHELGHIILGHLDKRENRNPRLEETEAETFVYFVLDYFKSINAGNEIVTKRRRKEQMHHE